MSLTKDDVRHIATLARLKFTDDELSEFATKLGGIVEFVDQLRAVDMDGIEPMAHPLDRDQRLRADEANDDIDRERFQQCASDVEAGLYRVPRVIE